MLLLSPFVPLFRELAEMRYFWTTPIHMDNAWLKDVLGSEPRTPLDLAVRETLLGTGCVPKDPQAQVIGSRSLAVSAS
jgi:nucleoside-diphosphate-sugar epimerase